MCKQVGVGYVQGTDWVLASPGDLELMGDNVRGEKMDCFFSLSSSQSPKSTDFTP